MIHSVECFLVAVAAATLGWLDITFGVGAAFGVHFANGSGQAPGRAREEPEPAHEEARPDVSGPESRQERASALNHAEGDVEDQLLLPPE